MLRKKKFKEQTYKSQSNINIQYLKYPHFSTLEFNFSV